VRLCRLEHIGTGAFEEIGSPLVVGAVQEELYRQTSELVDAGSREALDLA